MIRNLGKNRILWLSTASLSLIVASVGAANPGIYDRVVSADVMLGVFSQDLMTVAASIIALFLAVRMGEEDSRSQVVILGILGYLFYGYGIYVIERVYNVLYLVYMAIFGLSFYSIAYGFANIRKEVLPYVQLPRLIRDASVGYMLLNPLIFYPLWISQLLHLIRSGRKIEFLYSIYILDLCFIMPLFIIVAVLTAKNEGLGLLIAPSLFVLGFTLLAPLALGEFFKPLLFDTPMDTAGMGLFLILSLAFLILAVANLRSLKIKGPKA